MCSSLENISPDELSKTGGGEFTEVRLASSINSPVFFISFMVYPGLIARMAIVSEFAGKISDDIGEMPELSSIEIVCKGERPAISFGAIP